MRANFTSLSFKIISLFIGIITFLTIILVGLIYVNFREVFKAQLTQKGEQLADFFNNHSSITYGFIQEDKFLLSEAINLFMKDSDVVFAATAKRNGEIMAYRTKNNEIVDDIIWFISKELSSENARISRNTIEKHTATGEDVIMFFRPVKVKKQELPFFAEESEEMVKGYTILAVTMGNFNREFFSRMTRIFLLMGVISAATIGITVFVLRSNFRPLQRVREVAEKISREGDLREKPEVSTTDEIGEIASSFAKMIDILKYEINKIQTTSKRLADISREILKTMDKIKTNSDKQNTKIREIDSLIDDIYIKGSDIVGMVDDIIDVVRELSDELSRKKDDINDIKQKIDEASARQDEISSRTFSLKDIHEKLKSSGKFQSLVDELTKSMNEVKKVIGELPETIGVINSMMETISEGIYTISNETENIAQYMTSAIQIKVELQKITSSIYDDIKEIIDITYELLDSIDDTNTLAINASIIASHEESETAKEFSIVAEEIKRLAGDIELKVKRVKQKISSLSERATAVISIVENKMEEIFSNITKSGNNISSGTSKVRNSADEARVKFDSVVNPINSANNLLIKILGITKRLGENIQNIEQTILSSEETLRHITSEVSEMREICRIVLDKIGLTTESVGQLAAKAIGLNENLNKIEEEVKNQFEKVEEAKDRIKDLDNIIYEVVKIVLLSQSKTEAISELGKKLEEIIVKFKI